jgi:hypothetical protein
LEKILLQLKHHHTIRYLLLNQEQELVNLVVVAGGGAGGGCSKTVAQVLEVVELEVYYINKFKCSTMEEQLQ